MKEKLAEACVTLVGTWDGGTDRQYCEAYSAVEQLAASIHLLDQLYLLGGLRFAKQYGRLS